VHAAPLLDAELVVADSVKPYRGLGIAAAAPPPEHAERVPHHLVGCLDPATRLHAARWVELAEVAIADVRHRGRTPLVVGGTALYLKALLFGLFEGPPADEALRDRLRAEEDAAPGTLHARLTTVDPEAAARIHPNDRKRLLRALEVQEKTGRPISEIQQEWGGVPRRPYRAVGLRRSREDLRDRLERRIARMVDQGLVAEIEARVEAGDLGPTAREAIGVKELVPLIESGRQSDPAALASALEEIRAHTWQLARRQGTWWKRFPDVTWLDVPPDEPAEETGRRVAEALRPDGPAFATVL
jgi:tRNA dimethylallyltransferase